MNSGDSTIVIIIQLAILIFMIAAIWKVFSKAGQPGWASLVPFYNLYILLKIASKPGWWLILFFIPIANIIALILVNIGIARNLGKGGGFAAGLILLSFIFYPILGFGSAKYSEK